MRHHAAYPVALQREVVHGLLEQGQIGLVFQARTDCLLVQQPVGLRAGGAHRRAFARIEYTELDACFVSGDGHGAAQRVDFLDQMPFADTTDRRVAGHLPQGLDIVGEQQGIAAGPGGGERSLGPGVPAANHDHVEFGREMHAPAAVLKTRDFTLISRKP